MKIRSKYVWCDIAKEYSPMLQIWSGDYWADVNIVDEDEPDNRLGLDYADTEDL